MATEMDKLKREFLEYLEIEKGSSLRTIELYVNILIAILNLEKLKNRKTLQLYQ